MKKIVLIITGILAIGLFVFLGYVQGEDQEQIAKYQEVNEKQRPLKVRKSEIEKELKELADNFEKSRKHTGTTQLLFTDLNEQIHTVCYPILKDYGYTGVLALSPTKLPGAEGCLSVDQFKELMENGWTACITWDEHTSMKDWSTQLRDRLKEMDAELGQTVYFPKGTYKAGLDSQVQEMGFSIVVYNEGDAAPIIQLQDEEGIWHLGAVGFLSQIPKVRLTEAVAQKGNIVYLMGFELEEEKYEEESFRSMLRYFETYENNTELKVCSMESARAHYRGRLQGVDAAEQAKYEEAKAPLEQELADIEAKLKK